MDSDFEQAKHILCLAGPEQVQGLQWALDRLPSRRQYKIYRGQVHDLISQSDNYDFIVIMLDLGQPVPIENLKRIAEYKEGLCCFIQPTPGQLLALNEASFWKGCAWDGVSFEEVSHRVEAALLEGEARIQKKAFVASTKMWLQKTISEIGQIRWLNPPEHWSGFVTKSLKISEASLAIGKIQSKSHWKLPVQGDQELCEFVYQSGRWNLNIFEETQVSVQGDINNLKVGDQLTIGDFRFILQMDSSVEEIYQIANRLKILKQNDFDQETYSDLESYCTALLYSQSQGELQIKSAHKRGTINFFSGAITSAKAGSIEGPKALGRMLLWNDCEWKFVATDAEPLAETGMYIDLIKLSQLAQESKKRFSKMEAFVPPSHIFLEVNAKAFNEKTSWTSLEARVLGTIAEYHFVRDVLNYCPLMDLDIVEELISLRKQGLIRPSKSNTRPRKEL